MEVKTESWAKARRIACLYSVSFNMKHLFYIHSYITYFVSIEVIKYKQLDSADCIFMYGRSFKPAVAAGVGLDVDVPFTQHPVNSFAVEKKFWKGWKKLRNFNSFLQKLTKGEVYHVYTHQTGQDFIRMFISHSKCTGFSLIEEGVVSYLELNTINEKIRPVGTATWRYISLKWLNFFGRLSAPIHFFDPAYKNVFGLSADSFSNYARRIQLPLPFINSAEGPQYKHILVLDASAENGLTTWESMAVALKKSIEWLINQEVSELWIKYHPEQVLNSKVYDSYKEVFKSFENYISIKEIPQNVCLELIAGNQEIKELSFYIFISSLGIYATLSGRKVYSFAFILAKEDSKYIKHINNLPNFFKDYVYFVDKP